MILNKKGRDELRKKIEEQLQNVPEGKRVHLDKELLEYLLFEEIVINKETSEKVKLPIWSGEFLRKIDLSEVSFENVAWSLLAEDAYDVGFDEGFDIDTWNKFNIEHIYSLADGEKVNYSYTNAKIDFSKSWETKHGRFSIVYCDFSGVDLSNNDMSSVICISNSNLSHTGIVLTPEMFNKNSFTRTIFFGVDFSGVDLSKFTIKGRDLVSGEWRCFFEEGCNLSNTGINIIIDPNDMIPTDKEKKNVPPKLKETFLKIELREMIEKGFLDGCYINGVRMLSKEEKQKLSQEKNEEYEKMKSGFISVITSDIEEQVNGFGRN